LQSAAREGELSTSGGERAGDQANLLPQNLSRSAKHSKQHSKVSFNEKSNVVTTIPRDQEKTPYLPHLPSAATPSAAVVVATSSSDGHSSDSFLGSSMDEE